ncbi:hypothetical protein RJ55_05162 [Drechmeria coniospora]|nr:hypothetical protein RJ55_05162 [Drechmeria coniospora]
MPALGLDGDLISPQNFPLPSLGPRLKQLRVELHEGKGFGLIRGLDAQKYSVEDLTMLHLGVQSYIANRHGRQDKKGNMLVHIVADNSSMEKAHHHRHSNAPITFHSEEAGDIISWLTRSTAAKGGRPRFRCRPVIFYDGERLITNFGRAALLGSASHARPERLPRLTDSQMEALNAIESISQHTQLEIPTQAGDMHFVNNLAILHRREGFVDGEVQNERRHLVRMRLRDDEMGWRIPDDLKEEWSRTFDPRLTKVWHLEPMPDGFFPLRTFPN